MPWKINLKCSSRTIWLLSFAWCWFSRKCWKFSYFKVAESQQASKLRCCRMFNTVSLVSQRASSPLKLCFLCCGLLTVVNLTLIVLSFGSQLHSFWRWTCVCLMLLRKITFKQVFWKIIAKQGATKLTNASRGTVNAWRFQSLWAAVVMVVVIEFCVNALPAP